MPKSRDQVEVYSLCLDYVKCPKLPHNPLRALVAPRTRCRLCLPIQEYWACRGYIRTRTVRGVQMDAYRYIIIPAQPPACPYADRKVEPIVATRFGKGRAVFNRPRYRSRSAYVSSSLHPIHCPRYRHRPVFGRIAALPARASRHLHVSGARAIVPHFI